LSFSRELQLLSFSLRTACGSLLLLYFFSRSSDSCLHRCGSRGHCQPCFSPAAPAWEWLLILEPVDVLSSSLGLQLRTFSTVPYDDALVHLLDHGCRSDIILASSASFAGKSLDSKSTKLNRAEATLRVVSRLCPLAVNDRPLPFPPASPIFFHWQLPTISLISSGKEYEAQPGADHYLRSLDKSRSAVDQFVW